MLGVFDLPWEPCTVGRSIGHTIQSYALSHAYQDLIGTWEDLKRPQLQCLKGKAGNLEEMAAMEEIVHMGVIAHAFEHAHDSLHFNKTFEETARYLHQHSLFKAELNGYMHRWDDHTRRERYDAYWRQALINLDLNRGNCHVKDLHACLHVAVWGDCILLPISELFARYEKWLPQVATEIDGLLLPTKNLSIQERRDLSNDTPIRHQRRLAIALESSTSLSQYTPESALLDPLASASSIASSFWSFSDWSNDLTPFEGINGITDIGIQEEQDEYYSHFRGISDNSDYTSRSFHEAFITTSSTSTDMFRFTSLDDRIQQNRSKSKRYYLKRRRQRLLLSEVYEQFIKAIRNVKSTFASTSSLSSEKKQIQDIFTLQIEDVTNKSNNQNTSQSANERKWKSKCMQRDREKKHIKELGVIAALTLNLMNVPPLELNGKVDLLECHLRQCLFHVWYQNRSKWRDLKQAEDGINLGCQGPIAALIRHLSSSLSESDIYMDRSNSSI